MKSELVNIHAEWAHCKINTYVEVKATKQPMMTPFHSTYVAEDQYGMVVTTQLLLHNLPNTGKAPMHPMSLRQIKSSKALIELLIWLSML